MAQGDPQTADPCAYNRFMTNELMDPTLKQHILFGLENFMFETMLPAEMCVDWVCEQWNLSATDEVIDLVVDAHFAFHGE